MNKNYHTISHDLQVDSTLKYIKDYDFLAFDTETTGLNTRKDKVIGLSFSGEAGTAFYVSRLSWNTKTEQLDQMVRDENFVKIMEAIAEKELVMWNGGFDCKIVKSNFGIDLLPCLAAEGMLMKHSVDEDGFFALKRTAIDLQEHLGMDMEKEANEEQVEMKANVIKNGGRWVKEQKDMYKADLDIMSKYACADADLTLKLAFYYLDKLKEEGLDDFFFEKEVMPLYKEVTVKMEEKGLTLNIPMIEAARDNIQKDIEMLESKVLIALMETPEYEQWEKEKINKEHPPKKTGKFGQSFARYFKLDLPKTKTGNFSFGKKILEAMEEGPIRDFLTSADVSGLDPIDIYNIQRELFIEADVLFNISSKSQMGQLIFDHMKIKPLAKTPTGRGKFDDDFIEHLGTLDFEWTKNLSNYNKLIKIRGTYMDRFLNNQEDGMYYPTFKQHGTISGRYGSDLQQLPRPKEEGELDEIVLKYSNQIRGFFVAGKGRKFIDNDYESLEPHVFAHVSGDEGLKDIFRKGHDFYSTIAIATEKMEGVSADKKADNYLGKVNKIVRQFAKAYCYGMTAYALGMTLEITTEQAEKLIDDYLSAYPELKKWMTKSENQAKYEGFVRSEIGRIRHLPKVKTLHAKHGSKLLDYKYRNKLIKKHANRLGKDEAKKLITSLYMDYKNGVNNAKNFQIQSLSASIVNLAAIEINREFIKRGIDGWVALQIHDQLVMNVPEEKAEECRLFVQDIMENNYKLSINLKAPAEIGNSLLDAH